MPAAVTATATAVTATAGAVTTAVPGMVTPDAVTAAVVHFVVVGVRVRAALSAARPVQRTIKPVLPPAFAPLLPPAMQRLPHSHQTLALGWPRTNPRNRCATSSASEGVSYSRISIETCASRGLRLVSESWPRAS